MATNYLNTPRPCPCGSGKISYWQNDARGIPLCRTCDKCHDQRMSQYRPEVLTDSSYEYEDGAIEPEDY
jgi:hypothetical protein